MWGLCLYSYERCIHGRRSEDKTDHFGANSDKLYLCSSNAEVYWQCKLKRMSFVNRSNIFPIPRTKWRTVSQELGCASTLKVNCFKQGDNDEWLKSVSIILATSRREQLASSPVKLSISSWEASKIPSSTFDERTRAKWRSDLMWSSRKCGERWATCNKWGIFPPTMPLNYLKKTQQHRVTTFFLFKFTQLLTHHLESRLQDLFFSDDASRWLLVYFWQVRLAYNPSRIHPSTKKEISLKYRIFLYLLLCNFHRLIHQLSICCYYYSRLLPRLLHSFLVDWKVTFQDSEWIKFLS